MTSLLLRNFRLLEPSIGELRSGYELLIEGDTIRELSEREIRSDSADIVDCGGRVLMPGLIDCHVHVFIVSVDLPGMESMPLTLMTARATKLMRGMLDRGFTTVRDMAGADWGIRQAVEEGSVVGPRLFIAGQSIGPTGGHTDIRRRTNKGFTCESSNAISFMACVSDGVSEMRKNVREQMRQGADHVKIMMSGGIASPFDPLDSLQFSLSEVQAAVEEARSFRRYVAAHAYTPEAITRAAECGVRTIEHGNLIDGPSAKLMADNGMFLVANLVSYVALKERAAQFGMSPEMLAKNDLIIEGGMKSLEICRNAGVPVAYGSDLLGALHDDQSREFLIRREVMPAIDIIRSATTVGASVLRQDGRLRTLATGALADLLLVDGDPLSDLGVLQDQGRHLAAIMKSGVFHKTLPR